jgi:hypothetical protein
MDQIVSDKPGSYRADAPRLHSGEGPGFALHCKPTLLDGW